MLEGLYISILPNGDVERTLVTPSGTMVLEKTTIADELILFLNCALTRIARSPSIWQPLRYTFPRHLNTPIRRRRSTPMSCSAM